MTQRVQLPLTVRFLTAFASLSFLVMGAHELVHHVTARITCGAWGKMTFWQFFLAPGCGETRLWLLSTLAGPALTHGLIWTGVLLILRGRALPGIALVLANLPLTRIITVLMKGGDEMVLGRTLVGEESWLPLLALTLVFIVPALVITYRAMDPRHRVAVFIAFLTVPIFWDVLLKRMLLSRLLAEFPMEVNGVPVLAMGTWIVAGILLARLWPRSPEAAREEKVSVALAV